WLDYTYTRHGDNIIVNGVVVDNVGGNILQGHRDQDSPTVTFLAGDRSGTNDIKLRATYEPVRDLFLTAEYELQRTERFWQSETAIDHFALLKIQIGS